MNIFELSEKEIEKELNKIFENTTPKELLQELIECGLEVKRGVEMEDKIKIELKDIIKLQYLYIEIFTEEDEDYPDRRVIRAKEKAVQRILDKITNNRFNQCEIWKVIQLKSWDSNDKIFKPICDRLRELGYEIVKQCKEER